MKKSKSNSDINKEKKFANSNNKNFNPILIIVVIKNEYTAFGKELKKFKLPSFSNTSVIYLSTLHLCMLVYRLNIN